MTLEEAIQHCREVAAKDCTECGKEHLQLAGWLTELKQRREDANKQPKTNGDRIRLMTDEELAEWFAPTMMCNLCDKKDKPYGCNQEECMKYALIYMKKAVSKDAGTDD